MGDLAIRVEALGKRYRIGARRRAATSFREAALRTLAIPFSYLVSSMRQPTAEESIWALRNVSLTVSHGEVLGIIGRNGAGKSTLLKILSRITEPTEGQAWIYGRVGSLLEIGTGFHPDLTGRENIYLNGAILGMRKGEIDRKFDEIVAFSEVDAFIDTQVKRYSSGMRVRLGFAVAAHLEPEILIVDEVLAVGDASFQRRCIGKMGDVARSGRTVLFVSHNMLAVQSLCTRAIVLEGGTTTFEGSPAEAVSHYLSGVEELRSVSIADRNDRGGGDLFKFHDVEFVDVQTGRSGSIVVCGRPVRIRIHYECRTDNLDDVSVAIGFATVTGTQLMACRSRAVGTVLDLRKGSGVTECLMDQWPLSEGNYSFNLYAERRGHPLDWVRDAGALQVAAGDYYGSGSVPAPGEPAVYVPYAWRASAGDTVSAG